MSAKIRQFIGALLILIVALAITFKMELFLGWSFDLVFAALVAFAAFFGVAELLLLTGLAVWVMNWQPGFAPELLVFAAVPLLAGLARKFLPWRSAFTPAAAILVGILFLYIFVRAPFGAHAWFIAGDILVSIAFAYMVLYGFSFTWGKLPSF